MKKGEAISRLLAELYGSDGPRPVRETLRPRRLEMASAGVPPSSAQGLSPIRRALAGQYDAPIAIPVGPAHQRTDDAQDDNQGAQGHDEGPSAAVRIPSGDARVSTADEEKILRKAQQIARRRLEHEAQMTERKRLEKLERQAAEARADDDRGEDESRTRVPMNPERARHMAVEGKWGLASLWASNFKKKNNIPEPGPADVPLHEPAAAAGSGGEAPGRNSRLSQASGRASRLSDQSQLSSRPLPVKPLKTHALKQELPGRPPVEPTPREKRLRKQAELLHKVESLGQPEPSASASGESRRKVKKLGFKMPTARKHVPAPRKQGLAESHLMGSQIAKWEQMRELYKDKPFHGVPAAELAVDR